MKFYILASGSKGNCTLLTHRGQNILIDMGLALNDFYTRLAKTNISVTDISAIFYTHAHSDHLKVFKSIPHDVCYGSRQTLKKIHAEQEQILEPYQTYLLYGFKITPLELSHDSPGTFGYIFECEDEKLVYITDTGFINEKNLKLIQNANYYIVESNHNVRMLLKTDRPFDLIQRILSDYGHLSNEDSAMYMSEVIGPRTKEIVLAHISEEANTPDEALAAYRRIFAHQRKEINGLKIYPTQQWQITIGGDDED
ncbi:MAG: MBL fold metallo-hydrolase [Bacilli bacterium]